MTDLETEAKRDIHKSEPGGIRPESIIPLLFLGLLVVSVAGYFVFGDHWAVIISNHLGGLSIVGLFACLAGFLARKKGRNHRKAFWLGISLPVILGFIAVALVYIQTGFIYCGGGVVLLAVIMNIMIYAIVPKRNIDKHIVCS